MKSLFILMTLLMTINVYGDGQKRVRNLSVVYGESRYQMKYPAYLGIGTRRLDDLVENEELCDVIVIVQKNTDISMTSNGLNGMGDLIPIYGPGTNEGNYAEGDRVSLREMFGKSINADPEIYIYNLGEVITTFSLHISSEYMNEKLVLRTCSSRNIEVNGL